jgi:hypothetical protein
MDIFGDVTKAIFGHKTAIIHRIFIKSGSNDSENVGEY